MMCADEKEQRVMTQALVSICTELNVGSGARE
jgi:hypothetical protein